MDAPGDEGSAGLRIAQVTATFPPYWGGTGNVAWHNSHQLARLGHRVTVFTADLGGERVAPLGVAVRRLPPAARIGNAPLLPALLRALRPFDLVHLHYPFYFGAELSWAAARLYGLPTVVTYHNDVEFSGRLRPFPPIHHRLVGRRILRGARRLLFTTLDYGRSSYVADLAQGPTALELPNAVDVERFHPAVDGRATRRRFGLGTGEVVVLFVGALDRAHYFKGVPVLLRAVAALLPAHPALRLLIVGDGDLREEYQRQAGTLGLGERARFVGRTSDADLPACYAAADVVALPSITRGEAFGVVLLEAMATGRPVVATDLPGVRSVVRETGGGLLATANHVDSLARALGQLASAPGLRLALGQAGRRTVERRYAWPVVGRRLDEICRQVVAEHSRRGMGAH